MNINEINKYVEFITDGYNNEEIWELRFIRNTKPLARFYNKQELLEWIKKNQDQMREFNCYMGALPRIRKSGKDEDVKEGNVFFIDMDNEKSIDDHQKIFNELANGYNLKPSLVIKTGNGIHLYWKLDVPIEIGGWRKTQQALINFFLRNFSEYGVDKVVKNPSRIMRMAGTFNTKQLPYKKCEILIEDYTKFRDFILPHEDYNEREHNVKVESEEDKLFIPMPDKIKELIENGSEKGERHQKEYVIVKELFNCGYSSSDIMEQVLKFNKKCLPPKAEYVIKFHVEHLLKNNELYLVPDQEYTDKGVIDQFFKKGVSGKETFVSAKLGEAIMKNYTFKTNQENDEIYYYDGGVYKEGAEVIIKTLSKLLLKDQIKTHYVNETIFYIKASTYTPTKEFDKYKHIICLENGLYDMKENELIEHSPEMLILNKIPVYYDKDASCPEFKQFLTEVVTENDIDSIQEFFGYCLWKEYSIHKSFMLYGGGANGKSVLINALVSFLGKDAVSSIPLQDFDKDRFSAAGLYGKLANVYADLPSSALHSTGKFKMLTGNDTISAQKKFGSYFNFTNYAKMIFSCNQIPESKDDTGAFFRRWVIIMFNKTFEGEAKDPKKTEKVTTKEELSGIFNWAIEGLIRLMKTGEFSGSESMDIMRDVYIRKSNPVQAFMMDNIVQDSNGKILKKEMYNLYKNYCESNNLPVLQDQTFSKKLKAIKDYNIGEERTGSTGNRERCWTGISMIGQESEEKSINKERIDSYVQGGQGVRGSIP